MKRNPEKYEELKYTFTTFTIAITEPEEKLYETKIQRLFRNYLIELSNAEVHEINLNVAAIYDEMAIVLPLTQFNFSKFDQKFEEMISSI